MEDIIYSIRDYHRQRVFAMEQRKRADLALGAFLRLAFGWKKWSEELEKKYGITKSEQDRINKAAMERAADVVGAAERYVKEVSKPIEKRKPVAGLDNPDFIEFRDLAIKSVEARKPFSDFEDHVTRQLEKLAESLPVWDSFGADIKGFGPRSLGVIVGEAGNLSNYDNPAKLWKRMGLAVLDGVRQGGLRKGSGADAWVEHGYSARRRSTMYVIGDVLVKNQGEYRDIYLARLTREHEKAIEEGLIPATSMKATVDSWEARGLPQLTKVTKIDPAKHRGAGHLAHRAQRYMEKRLLKNLWSAWRKAIDTAEPTSPLPSSEPFLMAAE